MAIARRGRRRTYRRRKKPAWYNRKYNAMQLAAKAAKGVWYLKGLVNSELYKRDITLGAQLSTNLGTVHSLVAVPQGDAYNERTGISIFVRSINFKTTISLGTGATTDQMVMVYIVQDNQQLSDTLPNANDLLVDPGNMMSPLSPITAGRFKILKKWRVTLKPTYATFKVLEHYFNLRHHVRYNGTGAADIQKGGIYAIYCTNASGGSAPQYTMYNRLSYHDN